MQKCSSFLLMTRYKRLILQKCIYFRAGRGQLGRRSRNSCTFAGWHGRERKFHENNCTYAFWAPLSHTARTSKKKLHGITPHSFLMMMVYSIGLNMDSFS